MCHLKLHSQDEPLHREHELQEKQEANSVSLGLCIRHCLGIYLTVEHDTGISNDGFLS